MAETMKPTCTFARTKTGAWRVQGPYHLLKPGNEVNVLRRGGMVAKVRITAGPFVHNGSSTIYRAQFEDIKES